MILLRLPSKGDVSVAIDTLPPYSTRSHPFLETALRDDSPFRRIPLRHCRAPSRHRPVSGGMFVVPPPRCGRGRNLARMDARNRREPPPIRRRGLGRDPARMGRILRKRRRLLRPRTVGLRGGISTVGPSNDGAAGTGGAYRIPLRPAARRSRILPTGRKKATRWDLSIERGFSSRILQRRRTGLPARPLVLDRSLVAGPSRAPLFRVRRPIRSGSAPKNTRSRQGGLVTATCRGALNEPLRTLRPS